MQKITFFISPFNAKVLGMMKDECGGKAALEFVGLRSKIYGLLQKDDDGEKAKLTAKGVKRSYVSKCERHAMYVETLRSRKSTYASFTKFRSLCHKLEFCDL
jgi:hypothetical protein